MCSQFLEQFIPLGTYLSSIEVLNILTNSSLMVKTRKMNRLMLFDFDANRTDWPFKRAVITEQVFFTV